MQVLDKLTRWNSIRNSNIDLKNNPQKRYIGDRYLYYTFFHKLFSSYIQNHHDWEKKVETLCVTMVSHWDLLSHRLAFRQYSISKRNTPISCLSLCSQCLQKWNKGSSQEGDEGYFCQQLQCFLDACLGRKYGSTALSRLFFCHNLHDRLCL